MKWCITFLFSFFFFYNGNTLFARAKCNDKVQDVDLTVNLQLDSSDLLEISLLDLLGEYGSILESGILTDVIHGKITFISKYKVKYNPHCGFNGVDKFIYEIVHVKKFIKIKVKINIYIYVKVKYEVPVKDMPITINPTVIYVGDEVKFCAFWKNKYGLQLYYKWEFGDGSVSELSDSSVVSHSYLKEGTYLVKLSITDKKTTLTETIQLVVLPLNERIKNVSPLSLTPNPVYVGDEVCLSAFWSSRKGLPLLYKWEFGDGESSELAISPTITHKYCKEGNYVVRVSVTDGKVTLYETNTLIVKTYSQPVRTSLCLLSPNPAFIGDEVSFSGFWSSPHGFNLLYKWEFGDGESVELSSSPTATHKYSKVGNYTSILYVTDGRVTLSETKTIEILNYEQPFEVSPFVAVPNPVKAGDPISFSAFWNSKNVSSLLYKWEFGDGSSSEFSPVPNIVHKYSVDGTYEVKLSVTDNRTVLSTTKNVVVSPGTLVVKIAKVRFAEDKNCRGLITLKGTIVLGDFFSSPDELNNYKNTVKVSFGAIESGEMKLIKNGLFTDVTNKIVLKWKANKKNPKVGAFICKLRKGQLSKILGLEGNDIKQLVVKTSVTVGGRVFRQDVVMTRTKNGLTKNK